MSVGVWTVRTPERRAAFLEALKAAGNVTQAAEAAKISRSVAYEWRVEDDAFKAEWDAALVLGVEGMEDEARRRAFTGSDTLLIFMLKGAKPEKYRDNVHQQLQPLGADGKPANSMPLEARINLTIDGGRTATAAAGADAGPPAARDAGQGVHKPGD